MTWLRTMNEHNRFPPVLFLGGLNTRRWCPTIHTRERYRSNTRATAFLPFPSLFYSFSSPFISSTSRILHLLATHPSTQQTHTYTDVIACVVCLPDHLSLFPHKNDERFIPSPSTTHFIVELLLLLLLGRCRHRQGTGLKRLEEEWRGRNLTQ